MMMFLLSRMILLLAMAMPLAACSGLRIYSETRDKQGQAAVKAWGDVDLRADFKADAAKREATLTRELATSDKRLASERELAIRHLASAPAAAFAAYVDEEFDRLLGTKSATRDQAVASVNELEANANLHKAKRDELTRNLSFLQQRNAPAFNCEQLSKPSEGAVKAWQQKEKRADDFLGKKNLKEAEIVCKHLDDLRTKRAELLKPFMLGELGETQESLREAEDSLKLKQKQAQEKKLELDMASAAYQNALDDAAAGTSSQEAAATSAESLRKAIEAVEDLQTVFGDAIVSQAHIDQINAVIDNLKDGKGLGADATKAQIVITTIPTLADDVKAIQGADKRASLVPLLMWRDLEQGRLQAARVQVSMTEMDVALLRSAVETQLAEAQALVRSRTELRQVPAISSSKDPLYKTWDAMKDAAARTALYSALDSYLDAVGRLRQASERLRRTRYALSLEKSAALSEVNAGIWASLIGESVNQAAEFSATGVTPNSFTNFITALGVLGIAHGTNK